jgi:hypothetical protein
MLSSQTGSVPPTFERIEEYKAVLDNLAAVSARRQSLNDVFVGINTVFLTALGVLLFASRLSSWGAVIAIGAICALITPINLTWIGALLRYRRGLRFQLQYLREIETEFRQRRGTIPGSPDIGFFLRLNEMRRPRSGNTRLEVLLAVYFLIVYPLIAGAVAALTYCVTNGYLAPLNLT